MSESRSLEWQKHQDPNEKCSWCELSQLNSKDYLAPVMSWPSRKLWLADPNDFMSVYSLVVYWEIRLRFRSLETPGVVAIPSQNFELHLGWQNSNFGRKTRRNWKHTDFIPDEFAGGHTMIHDWTQENQETLLQQNPETWSAMSC